MARAEAKQQQRQSRRTGLPDWLDPELATLTRDRFSDPAWIFERKLDGERIVAYVGNGDVRLMTRNHHVVSTTFPDVAAALRPRLRRSPMPPPLRNAPGARAA